MMLNTGSIDFEPVQLYREIKKVSHCEKPVSNELSNNRYLNIDPARGKFFEYRNALPVKYAYIGRVNTCRAQGCSLPGTTPENERSEFFDYFILFDSTAQVLSVQVYNYEATHGQEITVKGWLKQFVGYNTSKQLTVGKNVDAISGATISVHSITYDISDKTGMLKQYLNETSM